MAKASRSRTKSCSSPSPPKTKSWTTEPGREASILPAVQSHVEAHNVPAALRRSVRPHRVTFKAVANIPSVQSETQLKLVELEPKLESKLKLQSKKLEKAGVVEGELQAVGPEMKKSEKTGVEDEVLQVAGPKSKRLKIIGPKLKTTEFDPSDPDTGRLRALADVCYSHLRALAGVAP